MVVLSCNDDPNIRDYFQRPVFNECIANGDGTMSCPGNRLEDSMNALCVEPLEALALKKYYNDKEYRLYICLKYPSECD